jgi:deoxyribose-phosphate aldolase
MIDLAPYIDHTLLKADAAEKDIKKLCGEAAAYRFHSVCVNASYIPLCTRLLKGMPARITTVIGFPLGATTIETKVFEARDAVMKGADELDMVVNVGMVKSGRFDYVEKEIAQVRQATAGKVLKVILETAYLTRDEKVRLCLIAMDRQADFVKTSTGFAPAGATEEDVRLLRATVGEALGVKASGGVRTKAAALNMVKAGATRLGTSSSVAVLMGE